MGGWLILKKRRDRALAQQLQQMDNHRHSIAQLTVEGSGGLPPPQPVFQQTAAMYYPSPQQVVYKTGYPQQL
jgi:hypothetical protein